MVDKKSISEFDLTVANGTETLVANQAGVTQRFEAVGFAKVFGLGAIDTPTLADLDAQDIPAGFYQWASGASGTLPRPGEAGYGVVIRRSSGSSEQAAMIAFDDNGQNIYYRQAYGGSWQAWQRLIDSGDTANTSAWQTGTSTTAGIASPADVRAAAKAYADGIALGVNQTTQDVSGSRTLGTTYQNATGQPIEVYIRVSAANNQGVLGVSDDNVTFVDMPFTSVDSGAGNHDGTITKTIPDGHYYRLTGGNFVNWIELRA